MKVLNGMWESVKDKVYDTDYLESYAYDINFVKSQYEWY